MLGHLKVTSKNVSWYYFSWPPCIFTDRVTGKAKHSVTSVCPSVFPLLYLLNRLKFELEFLTLIDVVTQ